MDVVGDHRPLDRVDRHGVGLPRDLQICRIERAFEVLTEPVQDGGKKKRQQRDQPHENPPLDTRRSIGGRVEPLDPLAADVPAGLVAGARAIADSFE